MVLTLKTMPRRGGGLIPGVREAHCCWFGHCVLAFSMERLGKICKRSVFCKE